MMQKNYLLFDIGATNTRLAVSKTGRKIDATVIFPTPKKFTDGMKQIRETAKKLCGGKIAASAGGIAGALSKDKTKLYNSPNLPDWNGKPLKKTLERLLNTSVSVENDAALAGLGEAVLGAGQGQEIVMYMTVSTGVNGVRVVDGKIDKTAYGFEIGRQILGGKILEMGIGGNEMRKKFGKLPEEIKNPKVWKEVSRSLAIGIYNSILHWSPHVVVLGGGLMKSISIADLRKDLKKYLDFYPAVPQIKKATLGDLGGLYGALITLRRSARL